MRGVETNSAEHRLSAARTRLLLERPFLGALLLHLPLVPVQSGSCRTLATDARNIYFNTAYVTGAQPTELQFMLAHEVLHCALQHLPRRRHRVRALWDAACDHAVNQLLLADGFKLPAAALFDARFRGLAAEEIYPLLDPVFVEPTIDAHWYADSGAGHFAALGTDATGVDADTNSSEVERGIGHSERALAQQWQQRLAAAVQHATAHGRLSPLWQREFERHTRPQLPWRALLARFFSANAPSDFSFQRLSRRSHEVLLPGLAQPSARIVVALDTSGSIGLAEIREFIGEVDALKSQLRAHVIVHACDTRLHARGPWEFAEWQSMQLPDDLGGGGGTRFTPVFAWLEEAIAQPDCLVYFTDAMGEFPSTAPEYPVLWLVKGNASVPWGERVQLE
jgi:predicted metal-dependent peptidase